MDINTKINWQQGMQLTANTFNELNESIDFKQQITARIANSNRFGLLPGTDFVCQGAFVKNTIEVKLMFMALSPSGKIIHIDDQAVIPIPMLYGDLYYLTIGFGNEVISFLKDDVPLSRPKYIYSINDINEIQDSDLFPVIRFTVADGVFSIDENFIPPCLLMSSNKQFSSFLNKYVLTLSNIVEHANLEDGDGKRALIRDLFLLKNYKNNEVHAFLELTQEIAQTIDYYIVKPNTESPVIIPEYSDYDTQKWLKWFDDFISVATTILDAVVLVDNSIDFNELKARIKAELYEQIKPELHDMLLTEIKDELRNELSKDLNTTLTKYINGVMKPALHDELHTEISDDLTNKLYNSLYDALYNALYVPEAEKEEFMPLI